MKLNTLILLGTATLFASCSKKAPSLGSGTPEYPVITVNNSDATLSTVYPAAIKGVQDVEIRPRVAGNITAIHVKEGQNVSKGQLLFSIDDRQYVDAVNAARAGVETCKAQVATAELTYNNKTILHSKNIVSDYELQTAKNNLATAKSQLATAKAQLSAAQDNLSWCKVTSPTSGAISMLPYKTGALVSPQIQAPLTTVSRIDKIHAYFSLNEKQILDMTRAAGGSLEERLKLMPPIHLTLSDGTEYDQLGKIDAISGIVDPRTGAVQVRATFENPHHLLLSGSSGNVSMPANYNHVMMIPQTATTEIQNKVFVFVLADSNKVNYTAIEIAPQNDGRHYIVTKGLKEGQKIVCEGVQSLKNGMKIKPITPAQADKNRQEAAQAIKEGKLPF